MAKTDESAGEQEEGEMEIRTPFMADQEAAVATDPCERPLYNPAVATQPLAALDPLPSDSAADSSTAQIPAAPSHVVRLVGMYLLGPLSGPTRPAAFDRRDGVEERLENTAVMHVCGTEQYGQRDTAPVHSNVALCACSSAIGRVRSRVFASTFRRNTRAVEAPPAPVDPPCILEPV